MKILPIYTYGFDILRKKTKKVNRVDDDMMELIQNMFHTMYHANGIGLAAPQIGLPIALTVIDISKVEGEENKKPLVVLNPKITGYSGSVVMEEGCLSLPTVRAEVERPEKISISYQDVDLKEHSIELDGLMARVAQHEIDHLNGILFIDHLPKSQRKLFKETLNQIRNGQIIVNYTLAEVKPVKHTKVKDATF